MHADIPAGFRELTKRALLSDESIDLIQRLGKIVDGFDRGLRGEVRPADYIYFANNSTYVEFRVSELSLALQRLNPDSIEQCICLALCIWVLDMDVAPRTSSMHRRCYEKLQMTFNDYISKSIPENFALIWVLMVAGTGTTGARAPQQHDFRERLQALSKMHCQDWTTCESLLRNFLYIDNALAKQWEVFWNETMLESDEHPSIKQLPPACRTSISTALL